MPEAFHPAEGHLDGREVVLVDPAGAGLKRADDPMRAGEIPGEDPGRQAELGGIGARDDLFLLSKSRTDMTGPKISSRAMVIASVTSAKIGGLDEPARDRSGLAPQNQPRALASMPLSM
jgi:hypothetical protein